MNASRNISQKIRWIIVLFGFIGAMSGCREVPFTSDSLPWVRTTEVLACTKEQTLFYPGKIRAAHTAKLAFRVAGALKKVYVKEGQWVKKGELLAELDASDYQWQYEAAQAAYFQVNEESERIMELYRRKSVPANEYDQAVSAQRRATAQYQISLNALKDTRLMAPFDGYIQQCYFQEPELVNQEMPVLAMWNDQELEVEVKLSVQDFFRRSDFVGYSVATDILPSLSFPLELIRINAGADFNQLFTARFRLKKDALPEMAPGISVSVTIHLRPETSLYTVVPIAALFQQQDRFFVWRYDAKSQTVQAVAVQVESVEKDGSVRIKSILTPGQTVVSAGVHGLHEGQSVKRLPPVSKSNIGGIL